MRNGRRLSHFRRQHDRRKIRRQRLRQIDEPQAAAMLRGSAARCASRSFAGCYAMAFAAASWHTSFFGSAFFLRRPSSAALAQLALQRLGVFAVPRQPVLRDVARINVLHRTLQRCDHSGRQSAWRKFWRQFQLVPLVIDRAGKKVDDPHAGGGGRPVAPATATIRRGFRSRIGAVRRIVRRARRSTAR